MEQNKKFFVEKRGKKAWIVIRQMPHDPQYKLGSHIPSYGKVVAVDGLEECAVCGEPFSEHRGIRNGQRMNLCPIGTGIEGIAFQAKEAR